MSAQAVDAELRHEITGRYMVALTQPLIQPAVATRSQRDVERLMAFDDRPWLVAYWATFLRDLIGSLDPKDPWRRLSGGTPHTQVGDTASAHHSQEGRQGSW